MSKYTIGIDYGTLSGRVLVADVSTGDEVASFVYEYPHEVMSETLPNGVRLGLDWALQHPQDYLDVLYKAVPEAIKLSGVSKDDIIGLGVDFTACTILPIKKDGTPLCFLDEYKDNPHSYVKLWKHHAAQDKANKLNEIAEKRGEEWLKNYGGKISSEWAIPKVWQILDEAPEVYDAADSFIEAGDWIVSQLIGKENRSSCFAGYKCNWSKRDGFPTKDFFKSLDPRLENFVDDKWSRDISPTGTKAGELNAEIAEKLGLNAGIAVAVAIIDAHVFVPAAGVAEPGKLVAIMGTSTCHMLLSDEGIPVEGISGVVEDGILPGFFGYEAGQACVGDHFQWFVENCVPRAYFEEAENQGLNIHAYLRQKAQQQKPGEHGLVALDWWNGNRSVLIDGDLTGLIVGMTLTTKPEDIYRALIEATAYGTRIIVDAFKNQGVAINEYYAAGGIAKKDPMAMQIYADIINMPVKIVGSDQGGALGSAIFGAVAAGNENGGYDDVLTAAAKMGKVLDIEYKPIPENVKIYEKLFDEYKLLHDYFGRGANDVMKRIKAIKKDALSL